MKKHARIYGGKKVGRQSDSERHKYPERMRLIEYNGNACVEKTMECSEEFIPVIPSEGVIWIHMEGRGGASWIERLGQLMHLHHLTVEDMMNTHQRPKIEDYQSYLYVVVRAVNIHAEHCTFSTEQLSLILGKNFVISLQENSGKLFDVVRDRIRAGVGKIRTMGADYLSYMLMDAVVDDYFVLLDAVAEWVEALEEQLIPCPPRDGVQRIHDFKRSLLLLRREIAPLRDVSANLQRRESVLVSEETSVYMRDVHDHIIRVTESIDTFQDMLSSLLDIYHSSISNRTNEIMKVLTLFSSIFMPVTFLTGFFGMNFKYFSMLEWQGGLTATVVVTVLIWLGMVLYFRGKGWF